MNLEVRFLKNSEIYIFQELVKYHFPKKNHIFVKKTSVINFYYNFLKNKDLKILGLFCSKKLVAAQGLITMDNWDLKLKKHLYLAFTVKSNKYKKDCLILFLNFIYNLKPNFLGTVGTNMSTAGMILNKISKIKNLDHYYISNPIIKKKISVNLVNINNDKIIDKCIKMKIDRNLIKLPNTIFEPKKSKKYFINKYLNNPFYKYDLMKFYKNNKLQFFFIFREIYIKSFRVKIIRIVDFYGNFPKNFNISQHIIDYLLKNNIEYIDFMVSGIKNNIMKRLGFKKKNKNIHIPNHFEPYDNNKSLLNYGIFINKYKKKVLVFKGDGDQDRPNK